LFTVVEELLISTLFTACARTKIEGDRGRISRKRHKRSETVTD
jgi:hypothetical protein